MANDPYHPVLLGGNTSRHNLESLLQVVTANLMRMVMAPYAQRTVYYKGHLASYDS